MKTKFLLVLIALNGLLLGANSASAATTAKVESNQNAASLSHTISELIDLDANTHSLVESAINRALIAKSVQVNEKGRSNYQQPIINGRIINGRIIKPSRGPLINGIIIKDRPHLINGIIIRDIRPVKPSIKRPLINGVIIKPN
jgi:hypothetical protein